MFRTLVAVPIVMGLIVTTAAGAEDPAPLKYYIGQEIAVVNVTTTKTTTRKIEVVTEGARKGCERRHSRDAKSPGTAADTELCVTTTTMTTRDGSAALQLVPDPALGIAISSSNPGLADDSSSFQFTDGMLLKSINVSSTGRAGDVLTSIAKFAGLALAVGGLGIAAQALPAKPVAVSTCNPFDPKYADLPDTARLWIWENQTQCDAWQAIADLQNKRDARVKDRAALQADVRSAPHAALKDLFDKIDKLQDEIDWLDKELKKRLDAFNGDLSAFTTQLNLGAHAESSHYAQTLSLADLPVSDGLTRHLPEASVNTSQFTPAAQNLWNAARVILSLDNAPSCKSGKCSVTVPTNPDPKKFVQIGFRQGARVRIQLFIIDQQREANDPADQSIAPRLRMVTDQWMNVAHPNLPISVVTFARSNWSKRDISMTFDEKGRPVTLTRASTSNIAALAAGIASAASALRDEAAATSDKLVQIDANRRTLQASELTAKLDKLKKQKDILDAQVQLDAAGTNRDAVLKQQQAAADLAALQAEASLQSAQASADQNTQIEQLKLQIEQVKQQIDLLQAQQQLDTLKKNGAGGAQ